ncbi:hypothetical protein GCK32_005652 [Trichostrongylus colubriformis]|uniref:Uncharacterized protein n=1 Tax=Trichostrongylus colubriformis TaxID=6319 RepID=A0AAN8FE62_TRICO
MIQSSTNRNLPWVVAACVVVTLVLAGALFYYLTSENLGETILTTPTAAFLNYRYLVHARQARNGSFRPVKRDVLIRGGNAVDAAIATVICEGGLRPHATGFGGGMVMLLHDRDINETTVISAYSSAPRSVTEETFAINHALAEIGYSSIATPGFLHGIWTAFRRYGSGRVAWQDLLLPTVHLLERGTPAGDDLVDAIRSRYNEIMSERSMSVAFNITPLDEGELVRSPVHAAFLRRLAIATDPAELFYRGDIANQIVHEMKQRGGLLSKIDLASYGSNVQKSLEIKLLNGFILKGPQPPSSFTALAFLVETLMRRYSSESNVSMDVSYMRVLLKAQYLGLTRLEQLGDLEYMLNDSIIQDLLTPRNETIDLSDEGKSIGIRNLMWKLKDQSSVGSHINVVDGRGNTVALSSSLNERFGSVRRSMKGGFVWNNEMSSFTMPDKEKSEDVHVNAIEGRKRPRTSMMPLMLFDYGGQVMLSL